MNNSGIDPEGWEKQELPSDRERLASHAPQKSGC
jgi:hypothetical protein